MKKPPKATPVAPSNKGDPAVTGCAPAIDRTAKEGLVQQVANNVRSQIDAGLLLPGAKLPSVREMARQLDVSAFTVAAAYDILVARYVIGARPGSGFYVLSRPSTNNPAPSPASAPLKSISDFWLSHDVFAYGRQLSSPGCGWLPSSWYETNELIGDSMRRVARIKPEKLAGYGHPAGYGQLRHHLAHALSVQRQGVAADQIILTHGATHAIDLILRTFVQSGDTVLLEDPTYSNLIGLLARHGCQIKGVKRDRTGLDIDAIPRLCEQYRPKLMFVSTVLHNPLGTTLRPAEAHRLLALGERYDFLLVEDDIFRAFSVGSAPCLATMDGYARVISVNGFSKTIVPSLRVGYLACGRKYVDELLRTKMLAGLTSSEINERIAFAYLSDPKHRRFLSRVRDRLAGAQPIYRAALEAAGLTILAEPESGMFISAGWPVAPTKQVNARTIAEDALENGLVLAPGTFFEVEPSESIWFRFNISQGDVQKLQDYLTGVSQMLKIEGN